jgi:hypothetical protein
VRNFKLGIVANRAAVGEMGSYTPRASATLFLRTSLPEQSHRFHDVYFALARAGLTNPQGLPSIWQIAVEMPLVSTHVHLASPPWPIQRAFLALLRPIAGLMGYKPFEESQGSEREGVPDRSVSR